jgi:signal transduction histidine kinase
MKNVFPSKIYKSLYFISLWSILLISFSQNLSAQEINVDSFKTIVNSKKHDTIRLQAAERIVRFYTNSNVDSAIIFAKQMVQISRKNNLKKWEAKSLNKLGGAYEKYNNIDSDSIIAIFQEALDIAEKFNYIELKTHLLNNIGVIYYNKGEYDKTIKRCIEALKIARSINLDVSILQSLNMISAVFFHEKEYEKAIKYAKQGFNHARKINHLQYIANFGHNIGSFYGEIGLADSTLFYYEQSLQVTRDNNMDIFTTSTLIDIGNIHKEKGRLELANKYALEAYSMAKKINYTHSISGALILLAEISYERRQYRNSIKYLNESFGFIKNQKIKLHHYTLLKKNYTQIGDYKSALAAMENYVEIQGSLFNIESKQQIEELTTKYEVTQKEAENQILKDKQQASLRTIRFRNYMALGLGLALLLAIGWGITYYRSNQQKKQYNEILEKTVAQRTEELKTANQGLAQSNKHLEQANTELRTFNYIASHDIKEPIRVIGGYAGLIFKKLPTDLKESLGEYFDTIKRSTSQLYTLIEDFANYTTMSKNETVEKRDVDLNLLTISVVEQLEETVQKYNGQVLIADLPTIKTGNSLLFTTVKNLIENGLKYNNSENPTVNITYNQTETHHEIIVSDNGIGIDKLYHEKIFEMFKRLHNRGAYEGSGIGLAIVKLSVEKLGGTIELESEEGKGSTFYLKIPLDN